MMNKTRETHRAGFTLIELLVVISIIALLVGILLPALGAARKSAQKAVCLGHQRSLGQGMAVYAADNSDWLAGPYTSGMIFDSNPSLAAGPDGATTPYQNMDWVSPTLGDSLGLPVNGEDRLVAIAETDLRCPSNNTIYNPAAFGGAFGGGELPVISYSASLGFHVNGRLSGSAAINPVNGIVQVPDDQRAGRLDKVGPPSSKVYAFDGARYVNSRDPIDVTFNVLPRQRKGGNFMEYGPAYAYPNGPWKYDASGAPDEASLELGYRHSGSVNTVFFDGHGQNMKPDEAKDINLWFPTGSIIKVAAVTADPNDQNGDKIR